MSKLSLAVDANNDLTRGADGNLLMTTDLAAVTQLCQHAAQTLLGEMIYAADQGIPYFDVAWNGNPSRAQFDAALRRTLLSVDGVQKLGDVTVTQLADKFSYSAVIQTIYGTATING